MLRSVAEAGVLDRAPMYSPSEHFQPGLKILSNDPSSENTSRSSTRADSSDSTNYSASESEHPKGLFEDKKNATYQARYSPAFSQAPLMPHEANRSHNVSEQLMMSWWPAPEGAVPDGDDYIRNARSENTTKNLQNGKGEKSESLLKRLEHRLDGFLFGTHSHHTHTAVLGSDLDTETRDTSSDAPPPMSQPNINSDSLYHVVLKTSHSTKDINSTVQAVRICGTYESLAAAKAFAHRCLFSAGYEREWFTTFQTENHNSLLSHREGSIVQATGPDGTTFDVSVSTVPNLFGLKSSPSDDAHHISTPLYHVVQTIIHYLDDSTGQTRDTTIQGSFPSYSRAREVAHSLLLWFEEGINKDTYTQYEEAGPGDLDCGYGENVVVHAVGQNGENFLVSVLKGQEMEADRVGEAVGEMR